MGSRAAENRFGVASNSLSSKSNGNAGHRGPLVIRKMNEHGKMLPNAPLPKCLTTVAGRTMGLLARPRILASSESRRRCRSMRGASAETLVNRDCFFGRARSKVNRR
jgi:hypothetical protein